MLWDGVGSESLVRAAFRGDCTVLALVRSEVIAVTFARRLLTPQRRLILKRLVPLKQLGFQRLSNDRARKAICKISVGCDTKPSLRRSYCKDFRHLRYWVALTRAVSQEWRGRLA